MCLHREFQLRYLKSCIGIKVKEVQISLYQLQKFIFNKYTAGNTSGGHYDKYITLAQYPKMTDVADLIHGLLEGMEKMFEGMENSL